MSTPLLPLPQAWTEHTAPGGQPYYYNSTSGESTYIHPQVLAAPIKQSTKKKERPFLKTPIPGTEWLRITTTEGNVFYTHKIKKESFWIAPEELKPALEAWEAQLEKISSKRKAEEDDGQAHKKAKVGDGDEDSSDEDEGEEEEWQAEAAKQLAAEAEEEEKRKQQALKAEEEEKRRESERQAAASPVVELSIEEGKALFKSLLLEKDINPLHPWDISLPKFISDPRYLRLRNEAARRETFEGYCKERAREIRRTTVKETKTPKEEFENLLKAEVKSTRTSWTDFRRTWKKDRRFYGWGRDDREREKHFKDFLRELGEQKRVIAQKAEADFFSLLKEHELSGDAEWKEAKKLIYKDPRYDAVGSSSLREELYNTFMKSKGLKSSGDTTQQDTQAKVEKDDVDDVQERRRKAVQEREDKIKAERRRLESNIEKSRMGINKEEGERSFMTLLVDAIRDPVATWGDSLRQLNTDPRFTNCSLPLNRQLELFHQHLGHLRSKQFSALHSLFETHCPSLAKIFSDLPLDTLLESTPVVKLGFNTRTLEQEFNIWQRERTTKARVAFDEMMTENAFVDFWGRLGKIGGKDVNGDLKIDADDIGEDVEEKVDMKVLAKSIDIREMEKVLKNDKRYILFNHVPEQRERWLRDYLSRLSAPKLSVHVDG